jgi:hypothetical protein
VWGGCGWGGWCVGVVVMGVGVGGGVGWVWGVVGWGV